MIRRVRKIQPAKFLGGVHGARSVAYASEFVPHDEIHAPVRQADRTADLVGAWWRVPVVLSGHASPGLRVHLHRGLPAARAVARGLTFQIPYMSTLLAKAA